MPNEDNIHLLKGDGEFVMSLDEISNFEAIFHDFLGTEILAIKNLYPIDKSYFKTLNLESDWEEENKADYFDTFNQLMLEIESGRFEKVILSRTKSIETSLNALSIFDKLNAAYKNTFNYVISNSRIGTWIGATPEKLLATDGMQMSTMSLAGTKTQADQWTVKEYREQQLVTDTILDVLKDAKLVQINTDGPHDLNAGKIQHLHTKITAQLPEPRAWKNLVSKLHPTPAVCGLPTQAAREFIPQLERHNRKYYTGFIGLISPTKTDFFVNLRCLELFVNHAKLYIGGGIISNSKAEDEWNETERKAETLGSILKDPI